jgi:hypothetical protein
VQIVPTCKSKYKVKSSCDDVNDQGSQASRETGISTLPQSGRPDFTFVPASSAGVEANCLRLVGVECQPMHSARINHRMPMNGDEVFTNRCL